MVLLCCEATAVLPQTHRQCQVVKVAEEEGTWEHQRLITQREGGWWRVGRRERKGIKITCILVYALKSAHTSDRAWHTRTHIMYVHASSMMSKLL